MSFSRIGAVLTCALLGLAGFQAFAQEEDSAIESGEEILLEEMTPLTEEFSGFTIDNTITRMGHEFARELGNARSANFPDSDYNITVNERPSAASGSQVWIEYDFRILYQGFLQPNTDLQELAQQIVPAIEDFVRRTQLQNLISDDQDLAPPEL